MHTVFQKQKNLNKKPVIVTFGGCYGNSRRQERETFHNLPPSPRILIFCNKGLAIYPGWPQTHYVGQVTSTRGSSNSAFRALPHVALNFQILWEYYLPKT